jgi:uncharacterized protein YdaU (DUF1376 family)
MEPDLMASLPYMKLFVADYLADTRHLTAAQHGAYLLLIFNYWQTGKPLPNDDAKLARIACMNKRDWAHNRDAILEFFSVQDNLLVHSRIAHELSRVEAKSLNNKRPGNANAKRTQRDGEANANETRIYTDTDTEKKNSKPPKGGYAFDGRVIKLGQRDFGAWRKAYPDVDLMARLQSRDDWLALEASDRDRERWFMSTSNYLANQQQEIEAQRREAKRDHEKIRV